MKFVSVVSDNYIIQYKKMELDKIPKRLKLIMYDVVRIALS